MYIYVYIHIYIYVSIYIIHVCFLQSNSTEWRKALLFTTQHTTTHCNTLQHPATHCSEHYSIHAALDKHTYAYACTYIKIRIYIFLNFNIHEYLYLHICVYAYTYIPTYIYRLYLVRLWRFNSIVCTETYTYINIHIYVCTYTDHTSCESIVLNPGASGTAFVRYTTPPIPLCSEHPQHWVMSHIAMSHVIYIVQYIIPLTDLCTEHPERSHERIYTEAQARMHAHRDRFRMRGR